MFHLLPFPYLMNDWEKVEILDFLQQFCHLVWFEPFSWAEGLLDKSV